MSLKGNTEGKVIRGKVNKKVELRGYSAYEVAVLNGFSGTEEDWLASLKGEYGKSAYQMWLDEGNIGTEEDFFASLKGADGYTPQKGIDYFDGKDGKDGKDGYTPIKGTDYFDGDKGDTGPQGPQGIQGEQGSQGETGVSVASLALELIEDDAVEFITSAYITEI